MARVMVTGANGFIGSGIVEALLEAGHSVVACVRSPVNLPPSPAVEAVVADFRTCRTEDDWFPMLDDIEAVVNCAGILRESESGDFDLIHREVPEALLEACRRRNVANFIQLSALGDEAGGGFVTSKHAFDSVLLDSGFPATVIRPSVVVSTRGSYGGTSLLRAMAALPGVLIVPGNGQQQIQPVLLEDIGQLVVRVLSSNDAAGQIFYATGPDVLTIDEFLHLQRAWLKLPAPKAVVRTPRLLVEVVVALGSRLGAGPMNTTVASMLDRGNVAPSDSATETGLALNYPLHSVRRMLEQAPSFVQDRWHARLYLLAPVLWIALIVVWLTSALAGFLAEARDFEPVLAAIGVAPAFQGLTIGVSSAVNGALGFALMWRWRMRLVLSLMTLSVLAYTLAIGLWAPEFWLEPLGGLVKNLLVLCALMIFWVLDSTR